MYDRHSVWRIAHIGLQAIDGVPEFQNKLGFTKSEVCPAGERERESENLMPTFRLLSWQILPARLFIPSLATYRFHRLSRF